MCLTKLTLSSCNFRPASSSRDGSWVGLVKVALQMFQISPFLWRNRESIWAGPWENVAYVICEQQRRRSACASAQSDQCLCCSLPRCVMSLVSVTKISNFMLASVPEQAGLSLTYSETPEDMFSHDEAHLVKNNIKVVTFKIDPTSCWRPKLKRFIPDLLWCEAFHNIFCLASFSAAYHLHSHYVFFSWSLQGLQRLFCCQFHMGA